jgi:hypothetical protein
MMKTLIGLAILLLLFNGVSAIFGGWSLITDPSGKGLQMPESFLEHSPFKDFLIPGIILFTANGIFSFFAIVWTFFRWKHFSWLILAQGVLLSGWILVQMVMIRQYSYLQLLYGSIGVSLFFIGLFLHQQVNK